jgi:hypothetical protein
MSPIGKRCGTPRKGKFLSAPPRTEPKRKLTAGEVYGASPALRASVFIILVPIPMPVLNRPSALVLFLGNIKYGHNLWQNT